MHICNYSSSPGLALLQVASDICVRVGLAFGAGITIGGTGRKAAKYLRTPSSFRVGITVGDILGETLEETVHLLGRHGPDMTEN